MLLYFLLDFLCLQFKLAYFSMIIIKKKTFYHTNRVDFGLGGLLKGLSDDVDVLDEVLADRQRDVAKHRQNVRLHASVHIRVLQVGEENGHEVVAEGEDVFSYGAGDVRQYAHCGDAHLKGETNFNFC